jgi:hypothetical protein
MPEDDRTPTTDAARCARCGSAAEVLVSAKTRTGGCVGPAPTSSGARPSSGAIVTGLRITSMSSDDGPRAGMGTRPAHYLVARRAAVAIRPKISGRSSGDPPQQPVNRYAAPLEQHRARRWVLACNFLGVPADVGAHWCPLV